MFRERTNNDVLVQNVDSDMHFIYSHQYTTNLFFLNFFIYHILIFLLSNFSINIIQFRKPVVVHEPFKCFSTIS